MSIQKDASNSGIKTLRESLQGAESSSQPKPESFADQLRHKNLFKDGYRLGHALKKLPRWKRNILIPVFKLFLYICYYIGKYIVNPIRKLCNQ